MWIGPGERRDVDDVATAALLHLRDRFVTAIENAEQIRLEHRAKVFWRGLLNSFEAANAGVIDENVESAKFFDCVINESCYLMMPAHITNQTHRATFFSPIHILHCPTHLVLMTSTTAIVR